MGFECYRIGDLLLDAGTQEVSRNGTVIPVPRLSFKLLLSLARHAPNVVSSQQLEKEVWEGLVVDRGTVNKRVLLLRKALNDVDGDDPYIAVIRGSGYRLIAPVERLDAAQAGDGKRKNGSRPWYHVSSGFLRAVLYFTLGMVIVLAVNQSIQHTGIDFLEPGGAQATPGGVQPGVAAYSQKSIAVLPFVDLSDGQNHQYLGDGIAEEVISLLTGMDGLEVVARTSSFAFRDTPHNAVEIAQELKVGTILEGSIRHSGNRIRVTAQLIDARTGFHLWSNNYDRKFDEVFDVQDDIAFNIAQSLKLTLDESEQPDSRKAASADVEAFALYLHGRKLFNERMELRAEGLHEALEFFRQAVVKDPGFSRAHAGIALIYSILASYDDSVERGTCFQLAEASANFALELNPNSTDALAALATVHAARGQIDRAAMLYERIRTIGSSDSNIMHWEAILHIRLGYFDELVVPLTEVYQLDPLNEHIGWSLATALNFAGRPDEAAEILKVLEHFSYRQYVLGLTAINQGDFPLARELLRDVHMRSGILPASWADLLIDAFEDPLRADEIARKIMAAVNGGELQKLVGFESLLILGSPRVFELGIDPAKDITRMQILSQVWNNWAVSIRQDPRFKEWVKSMGYADFWRKFGWPDRCAPTGPDDFECI